MGEIGGESTLVVLRQEPSPSERFEQHLVKHARVVGQQVAQQTSHGDECFVTVVVTSGLTEPQRWRVTPPEQNIVLVKLRDDIVGLP